MSYFRLVFSLLLWCLTSVPFFIHAQDSKLISGTSINFIIPQGELAKDYNLGIGIYGDIDYEFNEHFAWRFDLGWNDMEGEERQVVDTNGLIYTHKAKMSIWEFTTGFKASLSVFYVEVRGGYFTGIHEWGIIPAVGVRINKFDLNGSYKLLGDNNWYAVRIGYYWGK